MPFNIELLWNIVQGLLLIELMIIIVSSGLMTPKVVKYFVDSKIFVKSQQIKRIYDDENNKFKMKYSDEQLLKHPNKQIAQLALHSDYTLKQICIDLEIKNYKTMSKLDKIIAILKKQGIDVEKQPQINEEPNEGLFENNPDDSTEDEPTDEEDIEETDDDPNETMPTTQPKKPESIKDAKSKRIADLDKLSKPELEKIAKKLGIKYAASMKKKNLVSSIVELEVEKSVEAEGDPVKTFKSLEEGK